jgi:hypothetical protein
VWIEGLAAGKASRFGMGYNAAVWAECRRYAVDFLEEASQRLGSKATDLFDEALGFYRDVAQNMDAVSKVYPHEAMDETIVIEPDADCQKAVDHLRAAREAEASGLVVLKKIATAL